MNDKIVTHADKGMLSNLRRDYPMDPLSPMAEMLERLIAAAEADAPPLPEGWVLLDMDNLGVRRALYHRDWDLYPNDKCVTPDFRLGQTNGAVTPLRPTITEADVVKAWRETVVESAPQGEYISTDSLRTAFKAAGIEVSQP